MRRSLVSGVVAVALVALVAGQSVAQETGTPIFKAPYRAFTQHEFGASLSDPGNGVSLALEGFYPTAVGRTISASAAVSRTSKARVTPACCSAPIFGPRS